jgi:sensor c-di-GMP phosphodiesterase-like protein
MMAVETVSHYDLLVVLAIGLGAGLAAAMALIVIFQRSMSESRRLTRAAGVLVLQEAEKIRALVREQS